MAASSETAASYEDIDLTVEDDIAVLTINRPEVRNALRHQTFAEIEAAVLSLSARVLIVTGADPAFCSGDDVRAIMGSGEARERVRRTPRLTPAADAFLYSDIPVIAAVNGAAVGWGMELALMADFRVASERARFGELFVRRGLVSDPAGLGRLAQLVGREKAAELLMTGDLIDGPEALRIGLVGRMVPHDELLSEAKALAARLAVDPDWGSRGRWVSGTLDRLCQTDDHREGVRSFLEKREPKFVGH